MIYKSDRVIAANYTHQLENKAYWREVDVELYGKEDMLAVSSSSSTPVFGWPLEEAMYNYTMNHSFYDQEEQAAAATFIDLSENFAAGGDQIEGTNGDVRKLNHNASERHRRKKINELYSSLRSLLPASQQSRRMSIPTTVARVLKYIPELQDEVDRMEKKKQVMSKKINRVKESVSSCTSVLTGPEHYGQESVPNMSSVSTSKVGDKEVVVQISTIGASVSGILSSLEADGFQLITASSSKFLGGRVLLNIHLQKHVGIQKMECEGLDEKLLSMLEKRRR